MSHSTISHDGVSHHPLGAGSYYCEDNPIEYLETLTQPDRPAIKIFVGAQPNSSTHIGNIMNMCTAFALAEALTKRGNKVTVSMDLVDTAPTPEKSVVYDGVSYQRSLRLTKHSAKFEGDFLRILNRLHEVSGVDFELRKQSEIMGGPGVSNILREIIANHDKLGAILEPRYKKLGLRSACPKLGCGLADKHGITNQYREDSIIFCWPVHGSYTVSLLEETGTYTLKLELNT
ncbi:hypothetical protein M7I_7882 [Glarea lozoyensis 74030]|uniref:Uncharacterized protein n=1 Tax=Glarea lozoyensis (strain ATCC 74030 / MF5533) TaxID=1104152 RepID=H0EYI0_GLAL7|nr:hypothetical protein M7I_7882 [Glarea lozoyensis 74030]